MLPKVIERITGKRALIRAGIGLKHRPSTSTSVPAYYTTPAAGSVVYPYARVEADTGGAYAGGEFLAYVAQDVDGFTVHGYVPEIYATLEDVGTGQAASKLKAAGTAITGARQAFDAAGQALAAAASAVE